MSSPSARQDRSTPTRNSVTTCTLPTRWHRITVLYCIPHCSKQSYAVLHSSDAAQHLAHLQPTPPYSTTDRHHADSAHGPAWFQSITRVHCKVRSLLQKNLTHTINRNRNATAPTLYPLPQQEAHVSHCAWGRVDYDLAGSRRYGTHGAHLRYSASRLICLAAFRYLSDSSRSDDDMCDISTVHNQEMERV